MGGWTPLTLPVSIYRINPFKSERTSHKLNNLIIDGLKSFYLNFPEISQSRISIFYTKIDKIEIFVFKTFFFLNSHIHSTFFASLLFDLFLTLPPLSPLKKAYLSAGESPFESSVDSTFFYFVYLSFTIFFFFFLLLFTF